MNGFVCVFPLFKSSPLTLKESEILESESCIDEMKRLKIKIRFITKVISCTKVESNFYSNQLLFFPVALTWNFLKFLDIVSGAGTEFHQYLTLLKHQ